jgi:proline iminopeptidase
MSALSRRAVLNSIGLGFMAAPAVASATTSPEPSSALSRDQAAAIIANARKILTPRSIERLETVQIGGIEQWTSIRGTDVARNPALLFIHGGPGYVSTPMSWWFAQGWEEYFTVVQWDQRGAGKTYLINSPVQVEPTLALQRMVSDTEEMASWVRKTLGKDKIFVIGHSWGSYLGLELAKTRPEWMHAYIGVGQLTNGPESERRGWTFAMNAARKAGNAQAVSELNSIAPYSPPSRPPTLKEIYVQRKWLDYYGGVMAHRHGNDAESNLAKLSPDYTDAEIAHIWDGNDFSEVHLLPEVLRLDLGTTQKLNCPLIVFAGRYDVNVNSYLAEEWFTTVGAPSKRFVWFENSAHLPMTEEPGKFFLSLVRYARPISD